MEKFQIGKFKEDLKITLFPTVYSFDETRD